MRALHCRSLVIAFVLLLAAVARGADTPAAPPAIIPPHALHDAAATGRLASPSDQPQSGDRE